MGERVATDGKRETRRIVGEDNSQNDEVREGGVGGRWEEEGGVVCGGWGGRNREFCFGNSCCITGEEST